MRGGPFREPTAVLVFPGDTPEDRRQVAIPVVNMAPDPLGWISSFAEACVIRPTECRVWIPDPVALTPVRLGHAPYTHPHP
jgi:hypothetical protein